MAVLKQTEENGIEQTELYIDGEFVASWNCIQLPKEIEGIVCNML